MDVKGRVIGARNWIMTAIGVAAGVLVEVGGMAGIFPEGTKLHAVAVALGILGAALKAPGGKAPAAPAVLALLLFAAPARADDVKCPAALCAIGQQGNWGFGILPTISGPGIDVKHGSVADGFAVGTSLAATWMPGQLKSITIGLHAGIGPGSSGLPKTYNLGGALSLLKGYATIIVDWQAVGGDHAVVLMPALGIPL